jgi:hypothetical protein
MFYQVKLILGILRFPRKWNRHSNFPGMAKWIFRGNSSYNFICMFSFQRAWSAQLQIGELLLP